MVDSDDAVVVKRDLLGEPMAACALCHRPVAAASLIPVTGSARLGEPDDILHLCPDCERRIATGDITFEDAVAAGLEPADE